MILAGQLEHASDSADLPRFTIKGGVAIEMRLLDKARATRDIDLIVDEPAGAEFPAQLRHALDDGYQGFISRVKEVAHVMPNDSVRVDVVLEYGGRGWGTIQVDLSPREGKRTEVELVDPVRRAPLAAPSSEASPPNTRSSPRST